MTDPISFRLKNRDSQVAQLKQRQKLVNDWLAVPSKTTKPDLANLFFTNFDLEKVGTRNCENLIGSVELPVGLAGPVRIKSDLLDEEVVLPLATTEGALVASVNRGCKVVQAAGGAQVFSKKVGMTRAPVFKCVDGQAALEFENWLNQHIKELVQLAEQTSHHLKYLSHQTWVRGNLVYLRVAFDTDQAMGMNMVTIGLNTALTAMLNDQPEVKLISISSNLCTDKKDSVINRLLGRGYWVQAEVKLSNRILKSVLIVTAGDLIEVHHAKNLVGSNLAGSFSQNMQAANVVAAIYAATGQDLAHTVEGSQGSLFLDSQADGLYAAITLPSIQLGTIGGGTGLVAQSQARSLIRRGQAISAQQLAEVVAVGVLAGELSGLSALAAGSLACAHRQLGRSVKD